MSVKRALAVTGISQQLVAVITLCKTVVISRVLTPEEVGVYALAMAFLFFVQNMRLFGCYEYTLAEKDLTNDKLRACFSIVLTSSSIFLVLFLVGADVAAGYFAAPGLGEVLHILSISFLVNCFSIFTVTLLNRHMRFAELAVIQISAALLDLAVAVPLALNGYGANALAWGFVAASLLTLAITVIYTRQGLAYRPTLKGWRPILRFGLFASLSNILFELSFQAPALILGKGMGSSAVGYFTRGIAPITYFRAGVNGAIGRVAHAWYADTSRNREEMLSQNFMRSVALVAALSWPFSVMLYFHAQTIIELVFGPQWTQSVPIARGLALGSAASVYMFYGIRLLAACGEVSLRLKALVVSQAIAIGGMILVLPYGLSAFAWAISAGQVVSAAIFVVVIRQAIGLRVRDLIRSAWKSLVLAFAVLGVQLALDPHLAFPRLSVTEFVLVSVGTGAVWFLAAALIRHDLTETGRRVLRNRLNKRRRTAETPKA